MKKIHVDSPRKDVEDLAQELNDFLSERVALGTSVTANLSKSISGETIASLSVNKPYDMGIHRYGEDGMLHSIQYSVDRLRMHAMVQSKPQVYDLSRMWTKYERVPYLPIETRRAIEAAEIKGEDVKISDVPIPAYKTNMVIPKADNHTVLTNVFLAHVWNHLGALLNCNNRECVATELDKLTIESAGLNRVVITGLPHTPDPLRFMNRAKLPEVLREVTKALIDAGAYTTSSQVNEQYGFREVKA